MGIVMIERMQYRSGLRLRMQRQELRAGSYSFFGDGVESRIGANTSLVETWSLRRMEVAALTIMA